MPENKWSLQCSCFSWFEGLCKEIISTEALTKVHWHGFKKIEPENDKNILDYFFLFYTLLRYQQYITQDTDLA